MQKDNFLVLICYMNSAEHSIKRRALGPAVDKRTVVDMEQLKEFILEQNKELQETINNKLQETIDTNNKANINTLESILDEKLNLFAGYVDSKVEGVRAECVDMVKNLSNEVTDKICKLNDDVENRLDFLERQTKLTDVVIKNIPYNNDENMENLVFSICDSIEFKNTRAIKSAFRLSRNRNKSNPIIMKFYDTSDRREFMYAYFGHQQLNLTNLGFRTKMRVIICEALTNKNNEIFKQAMELKFKKVFWSVSTRNGFVYYRLDQKSQPTKITSLSSLNAFHSNGASDPDKGTFNQNENDMDVGQTPMPTAQANSSSSNVVNKINAEHQDQSIATGSTPANDIRNNNVH